MPVFIELIWPTGGRSFELPWVVGDAFPLVCVCANNIQLANREVLGVSGAVEVLAWGRIGGNAFCVIWTHQQFHATAVCNIVNKSSLHESKV